MRSQYKRMQLMPRTKPNVSELIQSRISEQARRMLDKRIENSGLSESAYIRRLVYRDLKILKERDA